MASTQSDRSFLKCDREDEWKARGTDQQRGLPPPPPEKPCPPDATLIDLTAPEDLSPGGMPLAEAIRLRRSRRRYTGAPLTLDELSFLLWATQGVSKVVSKSAALLRTVPSAGARHPFETYLSVHRVAGLAPGLYRYLPLAHKLVLERQETGLGEQVDEACYGQHVTESAVTFIWAALPDRTE